MRKRRSALVLALTLTASSCTSNDASNPELDVAVAAADAQVRSFINPNDPDGGLGDPFQLEGCEVWPDPVAGESFLGFGNQSMLCLIDYRSETEAGLILGVAAVDDPADEPFESLLLEIGHQSEKQEISELDVDGAEPIEQTCSVPSENESDDRCVAIFVHDDLHILLTTSGPDAPDVSMVLAEQLPGLLERLAQLEQS